MLNNFVTYCNANQGFMSAVLSFFAVVVSVVAIYISIGLTKKQNSITLFEKRYEAYYVISCLLASTEHYKEDVETVNSIIKKLISILDRKQAVDDVDTQSNTFNKVQYIFNYAAYFKKVELLFGKSIENEYSKINAFVNSYIDMLVKCSQNNLKEEDLLEEELVNFTYPHLEKFCESLSKKIQL